VFPLWRRCNFRSPAKGEVDGGEALSEVPGRVRCPKGVEAGEGLGSLAEAGLLVGGAQAILRAASRHLYLQYETMGGRLASLDSIDVGVEQKLFVVHLWTLCQKLFMLLIAK